MKWSTKSILLVSSLWLIACQNAKPELGSLGSIGGITLDFNSKTMTANNWIVNFSGKCKNVFTDIEWSEDSITWTSIKVSNPAAIVDCTGAGTFSGSLDLSSSGFTSKISAKISTSIMFRGVSELGNSPSLAFLLIPPSTPETPKIVVGAHETKSGGYTMKGQVGGHITKTITSGYVLQGQVHYK